MNFALVLLKNSSFIEVYSLHNEGKSLVERFIRTLKTKIYKYMIQYQKMYISIN